jgi:hypothetical protein
MGARSTLAVACAVLLLGCARSRGAAGDAALAVDDGGGLTGSDAGERDAGSTDDDPCRRKRTTEPAPEPAQVAEVARSGVAHTGEVVLRIQTKPIYECYWGHVLAVWIENDRDQFVRILATLGGVSLAQLEVFHARVPAAFSTAPGSAGFAMLPGGQSADIVASATLREHEERTLRWSLDDWDGRLVPDGTYRVHIEFEDSATRSALQVVSFEKGPEAVDLELPESDQFGPISLSYRPDAPADGDAAP